MALVAQGPGDNTAQTAQAYKSFMDMRSSKLIVEQDRGYRRDAKLDRLTARLKLKGEVL